MKTNCAYSLRGKGLQLAALVVIFCTAGAWAWGMQAGVIEPLWGRWCVGVLCAALMGTYLFIHGLDNLFVWFFLVYLPAVLVSMALLGFCVVSLYTWQLVLPEAGFIAATLNIVTYTEGFLLLFGVYLQIMGDA